MNQTRYAPFPLVLGVGLLLAGCTGGDPAADRPSTISEDMFVAAMAQLNHARTGTLDGELTNEERARILARHGLEEDDLLTFAEVHGGEIAFMLRILDEVARATRLIDLEDPAPPEGVLP
jgi:hypothetical protein